MINPEDLAELRARNKQERDELLADLEQRIENDPFLDVPVRSAPEMIFKTHESATPATPPRSNDDGVAAAIAEANAVCDFVETAVNARLVPLQAELAELRGQVTALLTVLGGADASRTKTARKRIQSDGQQLLTAPADPRHHS
jgi:hypothetical protein